MEHNQLYLVGRSSINRPFLLAIKKNRRVIILRQLPNLFSRQSVLCCPRIESSAGEGRVSAQRDMKTEPRARLLARRNPESGVEQRGTCGTCGLIRIGILMFGDILISIICFFKYCLWSPCISWSFLSETFCMVQILIIADQPRINRESTAIPTVSIAWGFCGRSKHCYMSQYRDMA